jgi:hypothetical protein
MQQLDTISSAVDKNKDRPVGRLLTKFIAHKTAQTIKTLAHIRWRTV